MAGEDLGRVVLYRLVYGAVRDRLSAFYREATPEQVRADPLKGVRIDDAARADPEAAELIDLAVDDALAGRRPRY